MSGADRPAPSVPTRGIKGVGGDPRERTSDVAEAPGKIWFRDLDEAVIEADRCIQCASCVAACPSDSIGIDAEEGRPTLVRMCTGCSRCWDYCPRSGLRYERVIELAREERGLEEPKTYAARAAGAPAASDAADAPRAPRADASAVESGQDGGVVTALLADLIEAGDLDGAIVARESDEEPLKGEATLATSREDLLEAAGSVYNQTMALGQIDDLLAEADLETDDPRLAFVGTPCMIQGASALERYGHESADPIALTVALMCTRTFEHERLLSTVSDFGVDPADVAKLDVTGGVLTATDEDGETLLEADVDAFSAAGLRGCDECSDFVGGAADVSAGSVGTDEGWTTVVVRTERGREAWERADGLESTEIDVPEAMDRLADWNRRRARSIVPREYDPESPVGITYEEHRAAYDGTDREPEPLNPARVHQYEEWC
ncbi:Coenzyme F420 hydrogenase/dehydrogenase, beta subunit C-terminal domain [Natrialbaceae archaeon GCM10025810]|uniref:Coenzyme F420 hydrogenase/dehydrogenase, beta subunit C-terminal domain n=1 Tax=Halovalidus salilacus TaxID=3075124 RepID=UPI003609D460